MKDIFETTTRGGGGPSVPASGLGRYAPQLVVSILVVAVLVGGAFYAARVSERAPQVVYSVALAEIEAEESGESLQVNLNSAGVEDLEGLPEIGPATAEAIVEYRRTNGSFTSVDDLEEVPGIGPTTLEQIKPFATV